MSLQIPLVPRLGSYSTEEITAALVLHQRRFTSRLACSSCQLRSLHLYLLCFDGRDEPGALVPVCTSLDLFSCAFCASICIASRCDTKKNDKQTSSVDLKTPRQPEAQLIRQPSK